MKSKRTILLILIIVASMIPEVRAITPQDQTIHITDTHDDMFITEVGIGIDSSLVTIKDPEMDIRAFLVFRELEINWWEPLKNATLRLRTSTNLVFDADSSITIYGMALSDLQDEGFLRPSTVLSIGFTSAHTDYNTSEFDGQQWHEINVTSIVEELIRNPNWDGHGFSAPGSGGGDAIGFHIVGAEGDDKRYFYDYRVGNGFEAQLIIHWNHEPQPPAGYEDATYNGTYRGYDIWEYNYTGFGWINYNNYDYVYVQGEDFERVSSELITGVNIEEGSDDDFRLIRNSFPSQTGFVLLSINVTDVTDTNDNLKSFVGHLFGHSNFNANIFYIDDNLKKSVTLGVITPENNTDQIFQFAIATHNAGVYHFLRGQENNVTLNPREYGLNITFDYPNREFIVKVYNDTTFDHLLETLTRTGYENIMTSYSFEFGFVTESRASTDAHFDFNAHSNTGSIFIVTDENGTIIDEDIEDYEDTFTRIDEELGADPEDPNPPGQGWEETGPFTRFKMRLYILMMGFFMLLGPLFYMIARRPSGYEIVIGLFIMLIGYAFLRAAAGI